MVPIHVAGKLSNINKSKCFALILRQAMGAVCFLLDTQPDVVNIYFLICWSLFVGFFWGGENLF